MQSLNIGALRVAVIELLRTLIDEDATQNDMTTILQNLSNKSRLAQHWIRNLIHPVRLMMYVRAEREGEFGLHLYACKEMMAYYFAAAH